MGPPIFVFCVFHYQFLRDVLSIVTIQKSFNNRDNFMNSLEVKTFSRILECLGIVRNLRIVN